MKYNLFLESFDFEINWIQPISIIIIDIRYTSTRKQYDYDSSAWWFAYSLVTRKIYIFYSRKTHFPNYSSSSRSSHNKQFFTYYSQYQNHLYRNLTTEDWEPIECRDYCRIKFKQDWIQRVDWNSLKATLHSFCRITTPYKYTIHCTCCTLSK